MAAEGRQRPTLIVRKSANPTVEGGKGGDLATHRRLLENCNCDVVCPCFASSAAPLTSRPSRGVCDPLDVKTPGIETCAVRASISTPNWIGTKIGLCTVVDMA